MRLVCRDKAAVDKDFLVVRIFEEDLRSFQRFPIQPEHDFPDQERERRPSQERIPQPGNRIDDFTDSKVFRGDRSVNDAFNRVILNQIQSKEGEFARGTRGNLLANGFFGLWMKD